MNKLTIPALLLGVVMIAGAFAFMPVQEASTVHTSSATLASSMKLVVVTDTCTATAADDCITVTVDVASGAAYKVLSLEVTATDTASGGFALDIDACTADAVTTDLNVGVTSPGNDATVTATDFSTDGNATVGIAAVNDIICTDVTGSTTAATDVVVATMVIEMTADADDPTMIVSPET